MSFVSKVAVITGGARGIGYETGRQLLRKGLSSLVLLDIRDLFEPLEILKVEFPNSDIIGIKTDTSNKSDIEKAFKEVFQKFKQIDIVVANAGICDERDVELTVKINLIGTIHTNLIAIEYMSKQNGYPGGVIVNLSSVVGLDYMFCMPTYTATKHGIIGFTRSMADHFHYNMTGIKFLTICPSYTTTNIHDGMEEKLISPDCADHFKSISGYFLPETPADTGRNISKLISLANNGTVWILENNTYREVKFYNHILP